MAFATPILSPQFSSEEQFAETFTIVADNDDGSFLLFQILFTNLGFGDGGGGCRLMYVPKDGKGINQKEQFSKSEWKYHDNQRLLEAGPCSIQQGGDVRFSGKVTDLNIEMIMDGPLTKKPIPNQSTLPPGDFFEANILAPTQSIKGTIVSKGKAISISGMSYMEHNRSNVFVKDLGNVWIRYRGFHGMEQMLFQVNTDKKGGVVAWKMESGQSAPVPYREQISIDQVSSSSVSVVIGDESKIEIESTDKIYVFQPTDDYGVIGNIAKGVVGTPTTTTYSAKATKNGETISTGILEVSVVK